MIKKRLFGTDGIRAPVGVYPLTEEGMVNLGKSIGIWLRKIRPSTEGFKILIGRDTRSSGDILEDAFSKGAASVGLTVYKVGIIPTPGVAFLTRELQAHLGAMLSASHNIKDDNGIKFFNSSGYKLSDNDECQIEEIMGYIPESEEHRSSKESINITRMRDAKQRYIKFIKSSTKGLNLKGIRTIIDCGYGSFSDLAPSVFELLGAEIISINDTPNGENINFKCGALYPEVVAKYVVEKNADIGLSFDGDGDRLIVSDEKGNILDGDYLMAILGRLMLSKNVLPRKTLVATHMSNTGLDIAMNKVGGRVIRTEVGDKSVVNKMLAEGLSFGGEQSGHIVFLNYSTTADGLITSFQIMKAMLQTQKPLSMLAKCMEKLPQVLINVKVKEKKPLSEIPALNDAVSKFNSRLNNRGRILIRYSGTEPLARIMVEGEDQYLIDKMANSIAEIIQESIGCQS